MRKINFKILAITNIVCILPIFIGLYYYNELPDMIPVHFNYNNVPNNYAPKLFAIIGLPLIMVFFQNIMCIANDLSNKNLEVNRKITTVTKWIIPVISVVVYTSMIMFSLDRLKDINKPICVILGIVFILLGNYLPKTRQNNIIGVKNAYTLTDEEIWRKTSRVTGYIMLCFGILFIISSFFQSIVAVIVFVFFIAAILFSSFVYPFNLARKNRH